jgi:hypothetical protein
VKPPIMKENGLLIENPENINEIIKGLIIK